MNGTRGNQKKDDSKPTDSMTPLSSSVSPLSAKDADSDAKMKSSTADVTSVEDTTNDGSAAASITEVDEGSSSTDGSTPNAGKSSSSQTVMTSVGVIVACVTIIATIIV